MTKRLASARGLAGRAFDEARGSTLPRNWTAEPDARLWQALQP